LAYARVQPADQKLGGAVDWLLAHRVGTGWQPPKAKGPALAALASFYGKAESGNDRYHLAITVNDQEGYADDVEGTSEGKAIRLPLKQIHPAGNNRVHFDINGRGTYGYAVTLTGFARDFGPDQDTNGKVFGIRRRVYWAPAPMLDGKPLAQGFSVA